MLEEAHADQHGRELFGAAFDHHRWNVEQTELAHLHARQRYHVGRHRAVGSVRRHAPALTQIDSHALGLIPVEDYKGRAGVDHRREGHAVERGVGKKMAARARAQHRFRNARLTEAEREAPPAGLEAGEAVANVGKRHAFGRRFPDPQRARRRPIDHYLRLRRGKADDEHRLRPCGCRDEERESRTRQRCNDRLHQLVFT